MSRAMLPKAVVVLLSLLNGGWLIFDGMHVLRTGRYFGDQVGPWRHVVAALGLDPMQMGVPFILLGIAWLVAAGALAFGGSWGWWLGVLVAAATLWYATVGTAISLVVIAVLLIFRERFL